MNSKDFIALFKAAFGKMFHWDIYQNPQAFYLLFLIPVLLAWIFFRSKKDKPLLKLSSTGFLANIKPSKKRYLIWFPEALSAMAILFIVFAIARPQDAFSWEEEKTKGIDIAIAMDVSTSMLAQDFKPNRFEASKQIAIDFIKGRNSDRFSLVVFAGEGFTQCPLTIDHNRLVQLFEGLETGILKDGTAIGSGLATSVKRLKDSDSKSKVIILLTDGENNSGDIAPEAAGKLAAKFGIKVYTIGIGREGMAKMPVAIDQAGNYLYDNVPVKIDEVLMKKIAKSTGGKYFRATGNKHLSNIYKEIDLMEKTELASVKYSNKTELFFPFAFTGVFLMLLAKLVQVIWFKKLILS